MCVRACVCVCVTQLLVFIFGSLGNVHRLAVRGGLQTAGIPKPKAKAFIEEFCSVSVIIKGLVLGIKDETNPEEPFPISSFE